MKRANLYVFVLSLAVFLIAPYIPNGVLSITVGTPVGVVLLLGAVVYIVRIDPILALAVALAVGALFLENRKRLLSKLAVTNVLGKGPAELSVAGAPVSALSVPAGDLIEGGVHPEHETPYDEEHKFEPSDTNDEFKPVGDSINEKGVMGGVPTNSARAAAELFSRAGVAPNA